MRQKLVIVLILITMFLTACTNSEQKQSSKQIKSIAVTSNPEISKSPIETAIFGNKSAYKIYGSINDKTSNLIIDCMNTQGWSIKKKDIPMEIYPFSAVNEDRVKENEELFYNYGYGVSTTQNIYGDEIEVLVDKLHLRDGETLAPYGIYGEEEDRYLAAYKLCDKDAKTSVYTNGIPDLLPLQRFMLGYDKYNLGPSIWRNKYVKDAFKQYTKCLVEKLKDFKEKDIVEDVIRDADEYDEISQAQIELEGIVDDYQIRDSYDEDQKDLSQQKIKYEKIQNFEIRMARVDRQCQRDFLLVPLSVAASDIEKKYVIEHENEINLLKKQFDL